MKIIVAVDQNWNIGKDNGLLAHLPGDLNYFKEKTVGKTLIMGRKTLESLPGAKPLKGRNTFVFTRDLQYKIISSDVEQQMVAQDNNFFCEAVNSEQDLQEKIAAHNISDKDIFVAGGENIYNQFLEKCNVFYVTKIFEQFEADKKFPNLDLLNEIELKWEGDIREEKGIRYQFTEYRRKSDL